ncbi:MAG: 3-deoxy-7-phosphoheptulonate synthase [candidate division WOR-3 bacterium]
MQEPELVLRKGHSSEGRWSLGQGFTVIAGPCAVESRESLIEIAQLISEEGIRIMRAGIFKPRTSPYSFRGLGGDALPIIAEAKQRFGLQVVSEVMSREDMSLLAPVIDIFQIGSRNMFNYRLLEDVGKAGKPVLLKRGMMASLKEFLWSAEYVMLSGEKRIILCERGVRGFDNETRNLLDLAAVPLLKEKTFLPVIVDPSHGTGRRNLVIPMARAALAAGADGVMVEVHPRPDEALSDGPQALDFAGFRRLVRELRELSHALSDITKES